MPYIDSEFLKKKIFPYGMADNGNYGINAKSVMIAIENAPAVDAVPAVRCKECIHRYVPARCALWVGNENGKDIFLERGDDFSCKYGEKERKEKNEK